MFLKSFLIRYLRYFLIGLSALLLVEVGGMIYINNVYLADNSAYSVVKVIKAPVVTVKYKSVAVSSTATQTASSYDGHYIAYLQSGTVYVTDIVSGDKTTVTGVNGMTADHFQWLYDRNCLAIAEKSTGSSGSLFVKLYSYDVTSKTMIEIRNNNTNQDLKIQLSASTDSVTQIDMSIGTGVNYVKVTNKSGASRLWKINSYVGVQRMGNTATGDIGKIMCLKSTDDLLYEDSGNARVYQYSTGSSLKINGNRSLKLLGIDSADNIYLAAMSNGKTDTGYYGSPSTNNWNSVNIGQTVNPANIYVTMSGNIYLNDTVRLSISKVSVNGQSSQTDSTPSKSLSKPGIGSSSSTGQPGINSYKGNLVDVFDNGFMSIDNGYAVHHDFL
jgi:hypothetical protein